MALPVLNIYSRRGCHLCEVLIEELLPIIEGRAELYILDIDTRLLPILIMENRHKQTDLYKYVAGFKIVRCKIKFSILWI